MDTQKLVADMKARFAHNSAKHYLKEKYSSKLLVADQNGLWKADVATIGFLNSLTQETVVMLDVYDNPVEIQIKPLQQKLIKTYNDVMLTWHNEYKDLEKKR